MQLAVEQAEIDRLRILWQLRLDQVSDLQVKAGMHGILQQVPLDEGQRVAAGDNLARVGDPSLLKAELRIAETQAKDIQIGQTAEIDTRNGVIPGHVVRIDPAVQNGTVTVDVTLEWSAPARCAPRPDRGRDDRAGANGRHHLRRPTCVRSGTERGQPVQGQRRHGGSDAHTRRFGASVSQQHRGPGRTTTRRPGRLVRHVGLGRF